LSYRAFGHLKWSAKNKESNIHLQRAVNKYGATNFKTSIVLYCEEYELTRYEQACVNIFNSSYNILKECVISRLGTKHSEKTKKKISKAHIGIKLSEEHKKKISNGCKGKNLGKKRNDETRKKISEIHQGMKHSEETKKKMSIRMLGNKYGLGYKHTEEYKKNMSIAAKNRKK
jgi:group I intron endonuclease